MELIHEQIWSAPLCAESRKLTSLSLKSIQVQLAKNKYVAEKYWSCSALLSRAASSFNSWSGCQMARCGCDHSSTKRARLLQLWYHNRNAELVTELVSLNRSGATLRVCQPEDSRTGSCFHSPVWAWPLRAQRVCSSIPNLFANAAPGTPHSKTCKHQCQRTKQQSCVAQTD